MKILSLIGWACLLVWIVVLGAWSYDATHETASQREEHLRQRIAYLEAVLDAEREHCRASKELAERSAEMVRDTFRALGVEP